MTWELVENNRHWKMLDRFQCDLSDVYDDAATLTCPNPETEAKGRLLVTLTAMIAATYVSFGQDEDLEEEMKKMTEQIKKLLKEYKKHKKDVKKDNVVSIFKRR